MNARTRLAAAATMLFVAMAVRGADSPDNVASFFLHAWVPELGPPHCEHREELCAAATSTRRARYRDAEAALDAYSSRAATEEERVLVQLFRAQLVTHRERLIGGGWYFFNAVPFDHASVLRRELESTIGKRDVAVTSAIVYTSVLSRTLLDYPGGARMQAAAGDTTPSTFSSLQFLEDYSDKAAQVGLISAADARILSHLARGSLARAQRDPETARRHFEQALELSPAKFEILLLLGDTFTTPQGHALTLGYDAGSIETVMGELESAKSPPILQDIPPAWITSGAAWYNRAEALASSDFERRGLRMRRALLHVRRGNVAAAVAAFKELAATGDDVVSWSAAMSAGILTTNAALFERGVTTATAQGAANVVTSFAEVVTIVARTMIVANQREEGIRLMEIATDAIVARAEGRQALSLLLQIARRRAQTERADAALVAAQHAHEIQTRYLEQMRPEAERLAQADPEFSMDDWLKFENRILGKVSAVLAMARVAALKTNDASKIETAVPHVEDAVKALPEQRSVPVATLMRRAMLMFEAMKIAMSFGGATDQCEALASQLAPWREKIRAEGAAAWLPMLDGFTRECAPHWTEEDVTLLDRTDLLASIRERVSAFAAEPDAGQADPVVKFELGILKAQINLLIRQGRLTAARRWIGETLELLNGKPALQAMAADLRYGLAFIAAREDDHHEVMRIARSMREGAIWHFTERSTRIDVLNLLIYAGGQLCACRDAACEPVRVLAAWEEIRSEQRVLAEQQSGIDPGWRASAEQAALEAAISRGDEVPPGAHERLRVLRALRAGDLRTGFEIPSEAALDDVIAHLPERATVLVYHAMPGSIAFWRMQRGAIALDIIGADQPAVEQLVSELQSGVVNRIKDGWNPHAEELTGGLFDHAGPIRDGDLVVIVASGILGQVPFELLAPAGRMLFETNPIVYAERIGVRDFSPRSSTGTDFVCGVDGNGLVGAQEEAGRVAQILGTTPLLAAEATVMEVSKRIRSARRVHLAMHTRLDPERPLESSLILGDRTVLRAWELFRDAPAAELVVLSACETLSEARPRSMAMNETDQRLNFAAFAFSGGAKYVLASLWRASDAHTLELMTEFYRALTREHMHPARALQRAKQRVYGGGRRHPYYFQNFVLTVRDVAALTE